MEFRLPKIGPNRSVSREGLAKAGVVFSEEADLYILAGDILNMNILAFIRDVLMSLEKPVIYVPGNHEFYESNYEEVIATLRRVFKDSNVYVLEKDVLEIGDVVFLGTCLWTEVDPSWHTTAKKWMNDFWMVEGLTPRVWSHLHTYAASWLQMMLSKYKDKRVAVVTHTSPSYQSMSLRFAGDPMNCLFHNNLDFLVEEYCPKVWVHGHTHDAFDYQLFSTRVVCNPLGYPREHAVPQYNP